MAKARYKKDLFPGYIYKFNTEDHFVEHMYITIKWS